MKNSPLQIINMAISWVLSQERSPHVIAASVIHALREDGYFICELGNGQPDQMHDKACPTCGCKEAV